MGRRNSQQLYIKILNILEIALLCRKIFKLPHTVSQKFKMPYIYNAAAFQFL